MNNFNKKRSKKTTTKPLSKTKKGKLIFITGPMFSGKTEKLIRRIRFAQKKSQKILAFKSHRDTRSSSISSRSGGVYSAHLAKTSADIWNVFSEKTIRPNKVFINEINFFTDNLVETIEKILQTGTDVICDGLLKDYQNKYFPISEKLEKKASSTYYHLASCLRCFQPARYSKRLNPKKNLFLIGGAGTYEARCQGCFFEKAK